MIKSVSGRLAASWLAGVAVAAAVLVPLRLGIIDRIFTTPDLSRAMADYLLTAGIGYFIGVFASLPLLLLAGLALKYQHIRVANAMGLWSASGALILAAGATVALHMTPLAGMLSTGLELRIGLFDTLGFFLITFGVSAMAFQVYDEAEAARNAAKTKRNAKPNAKLNTSVPQGAEPTPA